MGAAGGGDPVAKLAYGRQGLVGGHGGDEVLKRPGHALGADLVGEVQGLVRGAACLLVMAFTPLRIGLTGAVEGVGADRAAVEGAGGGREVGFRVAGTVHVELGGGV
ncbi:hypothetical protein [Streptomyces lavendulae]|uniref:hypothetical protein n=1 Tax=Streptomyces lavendulae TaxID=1914 RepID=UPI00255389DB|nr:hypothetical protein [Streptomyces lavendulae]